MQCSLCTLSIELELRTALSYTAVLSQDLDKGGNALQWANKKESLLDQWKICDSHNIDNGEYNYIDDDNNGKDNVNDNDNGIIDNDDSGLYYTEL